MKPFVVFALPRSKTAWIGALLSYKDCMCYHDPSALFSSVADLQRLFATPKVGAVDTALALLWPDVVEQLPQVKLVVVRRPEAEVVASLTKLGLEPPFQLARLSRALRDVESLSGVLKLKFEELDTEAGCKRLFEFCLPHKWDRDWWKFLRHQNIQVNIAEAARRVIANNAGISQTYGAAVRYYDKLLEAS